MRKTIIGPVAENISRSDQNWLDLERLTHVELTSEDPKYPVESALMPGQGPGWRANRPGEQTVRIIFDQPQSLRRIWLEFDEQEQARTQEFALRCFQEGQEHAREIVRQQYTFSPPQTIREIEDYRVELERVTAIELKIIPDISRGSARASLAQIRLA